MRIVLAFLLISAVTFEESWRRRMSKAFVELEHHYTGEEYQNELFKYRLFVPEDVSEHERLPILVWLHGGGECGRDNFDQLRWLNHVLPDDTVSLAQYRFFILVVQCPCENWAWFGRAKSPKDQMGEVAIDILRSVMKQYPIDPDRVYLSGVSSGGHGSWEMATRYPELFAAVAPMAGGPLNTSPDRLKRLTSVPIWAFNNDNDPQSPDEPIQAAVDEINRLGGIAHLTVEEGTEHDCWTAAFETYHIMDWLLAQRRGSFCWHRPGWRPVNLWLILGQVCLLTAVFAAVWQEWRRRRRSHETFF